MTALIVKIILVDGERKRARTHEQYSDQNDKERDYQTVVDAQGWADSFINYNKRLAVMNKFKDSITDRQDTQMTPEETVGQARRDFLKTAGKFAVYTPPAVMMLMKPAYATINKSMTGRPHHGHHGQEGGGYKGEGHKGGGHKGGGHRGKKKGMGGQQPS